ncbi:MAG: hypothetical protein QOH25_770 [Acidobacteriota bacterium]|nr:hypothetical protein [Acidobacteriota bacterium]
MSDDWAKRTFERLRQEKEQRRQEDQLQMQKAARISGGAPLVFEELVELIQKRAAELNEYFQKNVPQYSNNFEKYLQVMKRSNALLEVVRDEHPSRRLLLEFDEGVPAIKFTAQQYLSQNSTPSQESGRFLFTYSNSEVCLHPDGIAAPISLDRVAAMMLDKAAG